MAILVSGSPKVRILASGSPKKSGIEKFPWYQNFENSKNSGFQNHPADKTGKSKTKTVFFKFNTGDNIIVGCADFSKELTNKKGWKDHLRVEIRIDEFFKWMKYEAYK